MPLLRRHRRDRRARAPKDRKRRNLDKFVPSGDSDFAMTARNFALYVHEHYETCNVDREQAELLARKVKRFREALAVTQDRTKRTPSVIDHKKEARKEAEEIVRTIGAKIRTDPTVKRSIKVILRLVGLSGKRKRASCPRRPPVLRFEGGGDGTPEVHVLKFFDMQDDMTKPDFAVTRKCRPDGADRLELFIGFIPEGARTPKTIEEYVQAGYGWPYYDRSYTKGPIEVEYPMPARPMMIVYWARWADSLGNVGRFCKTCAARVEGWAGEVRALAAAPSQKNEQEQPVHVTQEIAGVLPEAKPTARHAAGTFPGAGAHLIEAQRMESRLVFMRMPHALIDAEGARGEEAERAGERMLRSTEALPSA